MLIVRGPGERLWHVPEGVDLDETDPSLSTTSWRALCGKDFESKSAQIARRRPEPSTTCPTCWHLRSVRSSPN